MTDYTEIGGTGAIQSAIAAALSPIPASLNTADYGHSDMIQAVILTPAKRLREYLGQAWLRIH